MVFQHAAGRLPGVLIALPGVHPVGSREHNKEGLHVNLALSFPIQHSQQQCRGQEGTLLLGTILVNLIMSAWEQQNWNKMPNAPLSLGVLSDGQPGANCPFCPVTATGVHHASCAHGCGSHCGSQQSACAPSPILPSPKERLGGSCLELSGCWDMAKHWLEGHLHEDTGQ